MKRIIPVIILISLVTAWLIIRSETPPSDQASSEELRVESIALSSGNIGDDFVIDVVLPEGYAENPDKIYPVIYMTDGNGRKPDYEIIHTLSRQDGIGDAIIAGIGYPAGHDVSGSRVRDFNEQPDDFLDFILNQVIPAVDQNYRTDASDRTLFGSSLGGYFSLYALVTCEAGSEDAFRNYVAVSWCCMTREQEKSLFEAEKKLKSRNPDFVASLYITVGSWETQSLLDCYNKMVRTLEARRYPGLEFIHFINEGMTHETNGEPTLPAVIKKYLAD